MTDVTIYAAPLPEGPEASHRLLRPAAALAAVPEALRPYMGDKAVLTPTH